MHYVPAKLRQLLGDNLYRNSFFLVSSRILNAAAGFLFWVIAAKLYSIAEVGTATALISALGLIMLLSRFGFDVSLVRFIEDIDKSKAFATSFVITTIASGTFSVIYILFIRFFQSAITLNFIDKMLFILIALCNSGALISGNLFMALRKGQHQFIQTVLITLRILLLFPLAYLKDFGILLSLGICYGLSFLFSFWVLRKEISFRSPGIDIPFVKESFTYSMQSFLSNILTEAPALILPIIVLQLAGQEAAAKYYIAMSIGNLTLIVPNALSYSLFVEGNRGQSIRQNVIKACTGSYLFLAPVILAIVLWGKPILSFISKEYADAYNLLILIVAASAFIAIYLIYLSLQSVNMRVGRNILLNTFRFVLLIGGSFLSLSKYGINGAGYTWFLTHAVLTLVIALSYLKPAVVKVIGRIHRPPSAALTTGPVVRHYSAKKLLVVILNTTGSEYEITVSVNDLTAGRKPVIEKVLLVAENSAKTLNLSRPPSVYEVFLPRVPPGVFLWTSAIASVGETNLIEPNTFCHKDFITTSDNITPAKRRSP